MEEEEVPPAAENEADDRPKPTFHPVEIPGELLSETIKRERR